MQFDLFHSLGRVDSIEPALGDEEVFRNFIMQVKHGESLGFGTIWVAESHYSSEVQKRHRSPVIPHYQGEVGLNCDSMQVAHWIFEHTERIGFGTAIFNIVGGNGGPIVAADRVRSLAWLNRLRTSPRNLHIGVAAGRFPYINSPGGIVPRNNSELDAWAEVRRRIFVEALEIFLRLCRGETLSSEDLESTRAPLDRGRDIPYVPRWTFDALQLVPQMAGIDDPYLRMVLGSADPMALEVGLRYWDLDLFNLSFTAPAEIERTHVRMERLCQGHGRTWNRWRMPRTVLTFIDTESRRAHERARAALTTYIEAMRGTVGTPPMEVLLSRALIGSPEEIRQQLSPADPHGFAAQDRLMLWFEFNQSDCDGICKQMELFARDVMPAYAAA